MIPARGPQTKGFCNTGHAGHCILYAMTADYAHIASQVQQILKHSISG